MQVSEQPDAPFLSIDERARGGMRRNHKDHMHRLCSPRQAPRLHPDKRALDI